MKIRKKCYCILILILLLFSLCSCSKTNKDNGTNKNSNNNNSSNNNLNTNNPPSTDENNVTNTTDSTQQTSITVGTRTNPLPFNTTILFNGNDTLFDKYQVELTLLDVVRGPDALAMVLDANEFNSEPEEGKEYLLAKFKFRALSSENDAMIDINNASFTLVSEDGNVYDSFVTVSNINPSLREMYAGATWEGYACFEVNTDDKNPNIVFLERNNNGIWFSTNPDAKLAEGSTVYVPAQSIPSPDTTTAEIGSRLNPIAIGVTTTYDGLDTLFDTYKAQITLKEVVRGDAAMDIVAKANELNELPADDEEYLLAKFEVNALESLDNAKIELSPANFELVSEDGIKYDTFVTILGLEPTLTDMYPGSKQEGYAYFVVKKNDLNPEIVFLERNNNGLWFSTSR